MKKNFRIFAALVSALIFCFQTVNACTIAVPSIKKEFRKAESIFIGKVVKVTDEHSPSEKEAASIPENWEHWKWFSNVTFEIKNKWKGNVSGTREFVAVAIYDCGCPGGEIDAFKAGKEFLVFADGKNFVSICDSYKPDDEWAKIRFKKLDSFWFRAWAQIYPF
jgi:hypothetical protein